VFYQFYHQTTAAINANPVGVPAGFEYNIINNGSGAAAPNSPLVFQGQSGRWHAQSRCFCNARWFHSRVTKRPEKKQRMKRSNDCKLSNSVASHKQPMKTDNHGDLKFTSAFTGATFHTGCASLLQRFRKTMVQESDNGLQCRVITVNVLSSNPACLAMTAAARLPS